MIASLCTTATTSRRFTARALALIFVITTLLSAVPALAQADTADVTLPATQTIAHNETLFSVPLTINSTTAFAGADLAFRCSSQLKVVGARVSPVAGVDCYQVQKDNGVFWLGFFSAGGNDYTGTVNLTLYCEFSGSGVGNAQLQFEQLLIHRIQGGGVISTEQTPNAILAITRTAVPPVKDPDDTDKQDTGKKPITPLPTATAPKKTSIKKLSVGKKQLTVTWKKVSGVTKYQVQYRVKGAKKWKTKTVAASKAKLVIKKLTRGKRYQVRIRAYKKADGKTLYAPWSAIKTSKKVK